MQVFVYSINIKLDKKIKSCIKLSPNNLYTLLNSTTDTKKQLGLRYSITNIRILFQAFYNTIGLYKAFLYLDIYCRVKSN